MHFPKKGKSPNKKHKEEQKGEKKNFILNVHMEADGEKLIQTKIEKFKIFIIPHIFVMIYDVFIYGYPIYDENSKDKPNFYD